MNKESHWTDKIADNVLCGYFYVFFVIFSFIAAMSLIGGIWIFVSSKMSLPMMISIIFNIILTFGVSATSALFLYLICERALKPAANVRNSTSQIASKSDYLMM